MFVGNNPGSRKIPGVAQSIFRESCLRPLDLPIPLLPGRSGALRQSVAPPVSPIQLLPGTKFMKKRSSRPLTSEFSEPQGDLPPASEAIATSDHLLEPPAFLQQVLAECQRQLAADASILYLAPAPLPVDFPINDWPAATYPPISTAAWPVGAVYGQQDRVEALHKLVGALWEQETDLQPPLHLADAALGYPSKRGRLHFRAVLRAPIQTTAALMGCIVTGRLSARSDFTSHDLKLLELLGRQAAVGLENAQHYQTLLDQERLRQEAQLGQAVQAYLLPRGAPYLPGWELEVWWQPAPIVSGGLFDFLLDRRATTSSPPLRIVVAEVAGKSIAAALRMALVRGGIHALANSPLPLAEQMIQLNRSLYLETKPGSAVTLCAVQVQPEDGTVTYVNAGGLPTLLYQATRQTLTDLPATGLPLGQLEAELYAQQSVRLAPGDCLLIYSPRIPETLNGLGERFGQERVQHLCQIYCPLPAVNFMRGFQRAFRAFTENMEQAADLTLLLIKRI